MKTRVKKLANGKWIAEYKINWLTSWRPIDKTQPSYTNWCYGDSSVMHCLCDNEEEAKTAELNFLAWNGK